MSSRIVGNLIHRALFGRDLCQEVCVRLKESCIRAVSLRIGRGEQRIDGQAADIHRVNRHLPNREEVGDLPQIGGIVHRGAEGIQRISA